MRTISSGTAAGTRTTWYLHPDNVGGLGFETEINAPTTPSAANPAVTSHRHYLGVGGATIGVLVSTGELPSLAANATLPPVLGAVVLVKVEYWHKDHLGSLAATTDHTGTVTARFAYDPFGKRRFVNGVYDAAGTLVVDYSPALAGGSDRGFTGHEHLDDIGLIHMNGRLYDPTLGVFLQADPFIQDMLNLQSYNRYIYCVQSPMGCVDPSGYSWLSKKWKKLWHSQAFRMVASIAVSFALGPLGPMALISEAMVGGALAAQVANAAVAGFAAGAVSTGNIKGALQGAFAGALFAGIGAGLESAKISFTSAQLLEGNAQAWGNLGIAVSAHAVAGCVTGAASGGSCGASALAAGFSKAITPLTDGFSTSKEWGDLAAGTAIHAAVGGTASVLGGGKFANGAQTGAFSYLFNRLGTEARVRANFSNAEELLKDPRVQAFLGTLAERESGGRYDVIVGGATFSDYSEHPNVYVKQFNSTAAGAYQFNAGTWRDVSSALGLADFSPGSQDLGAVHLLKTLGSISALLQGNVESAIFMAGKRWDAFPYNAAGASISGGIRPLQPIVDLYTKRCKC